MTLPADLKQVIDDTTKMLEVCIDYVKASEQLTIEKYKQPIEIPFVEAEDVKGFSDAAMPREAKAAGRQGLKGSGLKWLQDHAVK